MKKTVLRTGAQASGAPYSPGIRCGEMVFVSGQVPLDPNTRQIIEGDFDARVKQCICNVESVLKEAGIGLEQVVKTTVFLTDMEDFGRLNQIYGEFWGEIKPARSCVQVARLPLDADVEIEAIAVIP